LVDPPKFLPAKISSLKGAYRIEAAEMGRVMAQI